MARMAPNNQRDVQLGTQSATNLSGTVLERGWYRC
jgi:hypothetical protein